tara:strand:- start:153 stop:1280 length:1128 start_codon:yes stop_codon:yes gene_type:complete
MIVVIGDILIDEYIYGTSTRLSPEAPVPVVKFVDKERKHGGAANVYNNIRSLTQNVQLVDVTNSEYPVKQRIYADGHYVTRIDYEKEIDNSNLYDYVKQNVKDCTVVLSDYNKGTLKNPQRIITALKENNCYIIVDPKQDLKVYSGADIIKPNKKEYEEYDTGTDANMVVTLGKEGYMINGVVYPTTEQEVYDVTGAGDTFLAVMAYYIDRGNKLEHACKMANIAAGISVQHKGVYIVKPEDLNLETLVFTNGCFDILHRGHIELLKESRMLGGRLVVGLNSDESVRRLKGKGRPINNQTDRKFLLESLEFVDEVIIFDEDTPYELIKKMRPDIITKGGDYESWSVVGGDLAKVIIIPTVEGFSTTGMIERISND